MSAIRIVKAAVTLSAVVLLTWISPLARAAETSVADSANNGAAPGVGWMGFYLGLQVNGLAAASEETRSTDRRSVGVEGLYNVGDSKTVLANASADASTLSDGENTEFLVVRSKLTNRTLHSRETSK